MKTTMAACSRPTTTMMGAASRVAAAGLAVIVLGITAVPTRAGCYPADRINAQCYADLQTATAAALAANQPLWLPAGTYTLQQELVIDYSPLAATGFQIISDGAVIDATAIGKRAMSIECSGGSPDNPKGCFYFSHPGDLVRQRQYLAICRPRRTQRLLGRAQFGEDRSSDRQQRRFRRGGAAQLRLERRHLCRCGVGRLGRPGDGQVQFSRISGAASATAGTALLVESGYSFANTIQAIDLEVAQVGLAITSPYANRNTFVSPYINCPTPIVATAGDSNMLLNPSYGAAQPPPRGSQTGILTLP